VRPDPRFRIRTALPIAFALVLFIVFCALGSWQVHRRAWKLDLVAHVEQQLQRNPVAAPGPDTWSSVGAAQAYLPVTVSGQYLYDKEAMVQAMTRYGSGYWLLTPLRTDRNFIVFINRGFVDREHLDAATPRETEPGNAAVVTGLLRLSEPGGRLLQENDAGTDRWYSRDVAALGAARGLPRQDIAPYFIDAGDAPAPDSWPVGGLTVVHFRNMHLGYAFTWFALALMTALGAWRVLRERSDSGPAE
jgi:surfeit locus 1 family protein